MVCVSLFGVVACGEDSGRPSGVFDREGDEEASAGRTVFLPIVISNAAVTQGAQSLFTGVQVQNLSSVDVTNISFTYYDLEGAPLRDDDGALLGPRSVTLEPGSSSTFIQRWPFEEGGLGGDSQLASLVVTGSSDAEIAAITNVVSNPNADSGDAYESTEVGRKLWTVPMLDLRHTVHEDGTRSIDSFIAVQNTTDRDDVTVVVRYPGADDSYVTKLPARGTELISVADIAALHSASSGANRDGPTRDVVSAVVESSEPVAVVVVNNRGPSAINTYRATVPGENKLPLVNFQNPENSGIDTFVYAQNGASQKSLSVTYTSSENPLWQCTETVHDVNPFEVVDFGWSFRERAFRRAEHRESDCGGMQVDADSKFVGAARSSGDVSLVALQQVGGMGTNEGIESSYPGVAADDLTDGVVFPLLQARNGRWRSGFTLVNESEFATKATCVFQSRDGEPSTEDFVISKSGSIIDLQNRRFESVFVGSATCTSNNGALLSGVANQLNPGSSILTYRASPAPVVVMADDVDWWSAGELLDELEAEHANYRVAEADLGFHLGSYGMALDANQKMAFVEAFWSRHRDELDAYQATAIELRNVLERASVQQIAEGAGLDAMSGADIRTYIEVLDALVDTPEAQAALTGMVELRAAMSKAGKPLGAFISEDAQAELVAAGIESTFAEAMLQADPTLSQGSFNPSNLLDETFDELGTDGDPWDVGGVRAELSARWIAANGHSGDFTIAVREWLTQSPRSPVEQSMAMVTVVGAMLSDPQVGPEPLPDGLRDAMSDFQRFAMLASQAHSRGLQPLAAKLGEHARVWGRVAAPWVGNALGVLSTALTLGMEIHDQHNTDELNIYDRIAMVGSVASTGGTIVSAFGAPQVGVVLAAIGAPVSMLAGHLADAHRYQESRMRLRGEARELLVTIGLPVPAAHALASADSDALHIMAGTSDIYGGLSIGLTPEQIQRIAASNAEMLLDHTVLGAGQLDSVHVHERALILALLVAGDLLDRDDIVPTLQAMSAEYRDANPLREDPTDDMTELVFSREVEAGFARLIDVIGVHAFPSVHTDEPFGLIVDPCYTMAFALGAEHAPSAGSCVVAQTLYPKLDCEPLAASLSCWN